MLKFGPKHKFDSTENRPLQTACKFLITFIVGD